MKTTKTPAKPVALRASANPNATQCDHVAHAGAGWTKCERCGSTCTRVRGSIESYTRGTRDMPKTSGAARELEKLAAAN